MPQPHPRTLRQFDPNGVGLQNGRFIGLPFSEDEARLVFYSVPWDVTVSYGEGTARGPENILQASTQMDLYDPDLPDAWRIGYYFRPPDPDWLATNQHWRAESRSYIAFLEAGGQVRQNANMADRLQRINQAGAEHTARIKRETAAILDRGQLVGLVGGDHSTPLGYLQALAERHAAFGILQIDAHHDLREQYEGFAYSHASIFHQVLDLPQVKQLVQVGIRDYCAEEVERVREHPERLYVLYEHERQERFFTGTTWAEQCRQLIDRLPQKVYISFDVDGLRPELCPHTGTPVPGGLHFAEAIFLLRTLSRSGRTIIGFDLCETAGLPHEWDGNVSARLLYKMANLCALTQGWPTT